VSTATVTSTAASTGGLIDFSPQAHETRMNSWLVGYLSRENQQNWKSTTSPWPIGR